MRHADRRRADGDGGRHRQGQCGHARARTTSRPTTRARRCSRSSRRPARRPQEVTTEPLSCESVTLYQGGQYFLYKYKRYDDVRLVFAPEYAIAAFGGDPDNFQFPRWCLDMSVLRAYENGKPARRPTTSQSTGTGPRRRNWCSSPAIPAPPTAQLTVAAAARRSATHHPVLAAARAPSCAAATSSSARPASENERIVTDPLNTLENSIKVRRKQLDALHDDALMAQQGRARRSSRRAARADSALKAGWADPWADIEKAMGRDQHLACRTRTHRARRGFNSALFRYARTLVRGAAERAKPSERAPARVRRPRAAAAGAAADRPGAGVSGTASS